MKPGQISPRVAVRDIAPAVEWATSPSPVDYPAAVHAMEARAEQVAAGLEPELVWLLGHPPIYTAGTSAREGELLDPGRLPVHRTGRGGRFTYHGPGQRVAYLMLDVKRRGGDVRAFVGELERWIIAALADLGVSGETRQGRVGIWVRRPEKGAGAEDKIAAIGLRLRKWVSLHGISLNVCPDLSHYDGIVPCGIAGHGVTSLAELSAAASMEVVDNVLRAQFERCFAPTRSTCAPISGQETPASVEAAEKEGARSPLRKPGAQTIACLYLVPGLEGSTTSPAFGTGDGGGPS
jgi:lipoyl(octanoyl) transferase